MNKEKEAMSRFMRYTTIYKELKTKKNKSEGGTKDASTTV